MPPYLLSRDSPRAQHGRRRPPRGQLTRSGSLFGALKNIVSAPLAWLTSYDDQENLSGKRGRNHNVILEDEGTYHEDQPSAKRKRVDSPELSAPLQQPATRTTQGYLDVPENLISKQPGTRQKPGAHPGHGRSSSMATAPPNPFVQGAHPARRTASPAGIMGFGPYTSLQRTQSMDPPAYRALSLSRDVSMEDGQPGPVARDVTMSPSRRDSSFQLRARSSLTPQPIGQTFGPNIRHKERDPSEPPPVGQLKTKPEFLRAPSQVTQSRSERDVTTLGSLAEANGRISRSPMRQLFLGARPGTISESTSAPYAMPVNAAEKALHDLDVYKTPLLPSRLRGSQTIPDMFKPKKTHAPVLMRSDRERERKPRLGTSEKNGKEKEDEAVASKPYAGRGGMKKMLARRKQEEQEELEKERDNAIEEDQDEVAQRITEAEISEVRKESARFPSPPPPAPPARPVGGREQSSLRVGRTRTSRNHIARPVSKAKNRFSAAFDDDEGEDVVDEAREEEPKKLPTLFESPKGFTFAQDMAPVLHDSSNAKEPPISALPFSLMKTSAASTGTNPSPNPPFISGQPSKSSSPTAAPAPATTPAAPASEEPASKAALATSPPVPSISLIPPSPAPAKSDAESIKLPASSIPNFFANSSIFTKPGVTIAPPAPVTVPPQASAAPQTEAKEEAKLAATPSLFGNIPSFAPPVTSKDLPTSNAEASKPTPAPAFSFGAPAPASAPAASSSGFSFASFGQTKDTATSQSTSSTTTSPVIAKEPALAPIVPEVKPSASASSPFAFGGPATKAPQTNTASSGLSFSFGAPATTTTAPATTLSPAPFSFGQPKPEPAKAPEAKPFFGVSEPAKPSLFGVPPASSPSPFGGSQDSASAEAPKPTFTFGAHSSSTPAPPIEAPKPLFPSTSTGSTGGFNFGSTAPTAPTPATPAKSPFSFSVTPSTPPVSTPADNKPAFTFGTPATPAVSAPTTLFGGPSASTNGVDVSKPFSFGAATPARSITPPHKEQEMSMEESPTRGGGMDMNGESKPTTGFTFDAPSTLNASPFGQPSQPAANLFAFGAKTETKPEVKPTFASFGQNATSSPFAFGSKPVESVQSPVSPAPFGSSVPFGQAAPPITTSFSFGSGAPSGFGQPPTVINSQPASPSTFGQPTSNPFSFGVTPTSATAQSNPFAFGSQPASPAIGNAGLPQPPGSSGGPAFTFGAPSSATQSPSSPFGAATSLPTPGGVGFTIGSAAPQQGTSRQIKKLPNRTRGGRPR
ncbi:hypothetical protein BD309DRAFT_576682 [Dichomitus squalens]|uniref:Uncharacterized protein n=1 Tax=Dichomitus squalens TaxID=114155 RepID=A0A4Q9QGR2_9APHY|nr:hypothetical protein BD309DRAFT_576682 [Dichomitus squalens]TBU66144.1 hypothetical protein BD310DRAFT_802731 [Dichomitus squalens]